MRITMSVSALLWAVSTAGYAADDFIAGEVRTLDGNPEAGVWVIAETDELPTPFRKIVVTNDDGKFVLPELPNAAYRVWVRGYGLIDSSPVDAVRGTPLNLTAVSATDPREAALIYPASYWLSLFEPPAQEVFGRPGQGGGEGGIFGGQDQENTGDPFNSRSAWTAQLKLNCVLCHQLGTAITRKPERASFDHGFLKAAAMNYFADTLGRPRLLDSLAAWGARIAHGETPAPPPRPSGIERNIVITQWEWGDGYTYAHDEIATDKRNPTVNAGGPVYGVDLANDYLLVVDPRTHTNGRIKVPTHAEFKTPWCDQTYRAPNSEQTTPFGFGSLGCPWPGGETAFANRYQNPANPHNPMMDASGRIWLTTQIRRQWAADLPAFCQSDPVISANRHHRQLGYYDPTRRQFELIDTCFGTHHLQFDSQGVVWTSGDDYVIGWFDPQKYDPGNPNNLAAAQGHSETRLDSDGDGKPDRTLVGFHYGVIPNPIDRGVWSAVPPGISSPPGEPGWILHYDPATDRHEAFSPPVPGMGPRGIDVDSSGIIWTALAGSGHLARFDRKQCKQTWGGGAQCPEGWTLWRTPGPGFKGLKPTDPEGSTDMHYYLWVDQFDTLGLGRDVVIVNGTNSDSLLAFDPVSQQFTTLRVPYPLNTYTRGLDGRIDDPNTGWKGRGVWFTNGLDPILHSEIPRSYAGHIQLRPDPLAH